MPSSLALILSVLVASLVVLQIGAAPVLLENKAARSLTAADTLPRDVAVVPIGSRTLKPAEQRPQQPQPQEPPVPPPQPQPQQQLSKLFQPPSVLGPVRVESKPAPENFDLTERGTGAAAADTLARDVAVVPISSRGFKIFNKGNKAGSGGTLESPLSDGPDVPAAVPAVPAKAKILKAQPSLPPTLSSPSTPVKVVPDRDGQVDLSQQL